MKKYGRHYLRRGLSVLLAVVMTCAAAQSLVYAVELAENDTVTPDWNEGTARARYTTSGTLEISFPEADVQNGDGTGVEYYADFYDLDNVSGEDYSGRETPVNDTPYQLSISGQTLAEGDATQLLSASLTAEQIDALNLDMSHRISIAITAVKGNWRSEAIEALVGESLDVPQAGSSPDGSDDYVLLADFNTTTSGQPITEEITQNPTNGAPSWIYSGINGNTGAMDINGVLVDVGDADEADILYKTPGFDASNAFRVYVNGSNNLKGQDQYESLDIQYNQQHFMFTNADDLWIWVDTSYVEFEEFAVQVRYSDRTGTLVIDSASQHPVRNAERPSVAYSSDSYSTVGYAMRNNGEAVPVRYLNEDGIWDTMYTNENGYLENFGHYRGFLRVPVDYLWNDNPEETQYLEVDDERPYHYTINVDDDSIYNEGVIATFTAEAAYNGGEFHWEDYPAAAWWTHETVYFNRDTFEAGYSEGLSVTPIDDIISVGVTYRGLSDDSMNKSFYIDHIGFSGKDMKTNRGVTDGTPVDVTQSLDYFAMVPSDSEAVDALIDKYLPAEPTAVTVADLSVVEDLEAICDQLGLEYPDALKTARQTLDNQLNQYIDVVDYVSTQLERSDLSASDISALFDVYYSFTLGEIHRLGLKNEAKLIRLYNDASLSEWYPGELGDMYFKLFNDLENYSTGSTAYHEYDDYQPEPNDYFRFAHTIDWELTGGVEANKAAWENSRNFIAYSWKNYGNSDLGEDQRFGYGVSRIDQSGFDNSRSVDTSIYRDPLSESNETENYRISLTYQGDEADDYTQLDGSTYAGADSFVFYVDFSNMTAQDIRKAWIVVRSADGEAYSHDEGATQLQYQFFNLDNDSNAWTNMMSADTEDGCLSSELAGLRGFVRIPLSSFAQVGNTSVALDPSQTIKQVKFFISGNAGGRNRLNNSFVVDMFGFASNSPQEGFVQFDSLSTQVESPKYDTTLTIESVTELFNSQFKYVEDQSLYLFDYSAESYLSLLKAYDTLTVAEKKQVDSLTAEKGFSVDELRLFVKNYDPYGNLGDGNLMVNAGIETGYTQEIVRLFGLGQESTNWANYDNILSVYDSYPDYYKYAVQTYWPDRNLHAVYPNFNPKDVIPTGGVTMQYSEADGGQYTTTFNFDYVGMVGSDAVKDASMKFQVNDLTLESSDGTQIPISVTHIATGDPVANGDTNKQITLSVPTANVPAGNYSGNLVISFDVLPDSNNEDEASNPDPVADPDQYRKTITIPVTLTSVATYKVTIPADIEVPWGTPEKLVEGYAVKECFMPEGSSLTLRISSDGEYAMVNNDKKIAYNLEGDEDKFGVNTPEDYPLTVKVDSDQWTQGGLAQGIYQDTLTFTVEVVQDEASA